MRNVFVSAAGIVSVFGLVGCGQGETRSQSVVCLRFIEEPPQTVLSRGSTADYATILGRPWLVDLGGELRSALVSAPGAAHDRELHVPVGAHLQFAYATGFSTVPPIEIRAEALWGESATLLFSARLDQESPPEWQDASIDLAALAGRTVRLRMRSIAQGPLSADSLIFWGHPEVIERRSAASASPPSVALISIDSLRADHLSLYGYRRPTSPQLDAWARSRATVFLNAIAQAPWTLPSHVSMLTGIDAHRHGINHRQPIPAAAELLAERFRRAGYTTVAVTGGGWLHPRNGFAQGFDVFSYWRRSESRHNQVEELRVGVARAMKLLEEFRDRPLFLFFHTYEVHTPYQPRSPYFRSFLDIEPTAPVTLSHEQRSAEVGFQPRKHFIFADASESGLRPDPALVAALYDSGIAFADAHVARLLARVEEIGSPAGTVIAVTSDHGEMLGEHGLVGHGQLSEETLRVPLVLAAADARGAGRRVSRQARSTDLVPTLLELASLPEASGLDGRSLVALMTASSRDRSSWAPDEAWSWASGSNQGISLRVGNRLEYVLNTNAWDSVGERESLYDLRRDPREEHNLAGVTRSSRLRRRVTQALYSSLPGLRVRFGNSGSTPFWSRLRGSLIDPDRVELTGPLCSCISWEADEAALITVEPGREYILSIETLERHELGLEVASHGGEPVATVVPFEELEVPFTLGRGNDGIWRRLEKPDEDTTASVTVWFEAGPWPPPATAKSESDEYLESELRALGYLQ